MSNSRGVLVSTTLMNDIIDMPHPSADYHEGCVTRVIPSPCAYVLARGNILIIASK
jgi:hypothetical protein